MVDIVARFNERTLNLYEVARCHALGSFFKHLLMHLNCFLCIIC